MVFYTCILQSDVDASFYIGFTSNLSRRIEEHNKPFRLAGHIRYDLLKLRLDLLKFGLAKNGGSIKKVAAPNSVPGDSQLFYKMLVYKTL